MVIHPAARVVSSCKPSQLISASGVRVDMDMLLQLGIGVFAVGLVGSNVVLVLTRRPKREGHGIPAKYKIATWVSAGLALLGLCLVGAALVLG